VKKLRLTPEVLKLDLPFTETRIKRFIKDYIKKSKTKGAVLGLSGGIDSSTIAALTSLALGAEKVLAISMPEKETYNSLDIKHVKMVVEKFGFKIETIDITPMLQAYYSSLPIYDKKDTLSKGNIKARVRMICLYYYANHLNRIVIGSSDKSETLMGYFTKWGDVAADISPLMDLYKTQVRQLATHIGVPTEIIVKPSTPQLWPGQLAEDELGIKYEILDLILLGLENFVDPKEIANQLNIPLKHITHIKQQLLSKEHKRRLPLTLKTEYRTIGTDFRLPYITY
jgi:NAD+ synthase